jgi:Mor family transcriptional regulator
MISDQKPGYPELLADLGDQVAIKLGQLGVGQEKALEIGWHVAEHVRTHWSGGSLYVPKGANYELSARDLEIYRQFNGRNHGDLARQYRLTDMRIYQIVKAARAAQVENNQGKLF